LEVGIGFGRQSKPSTLEDLPIYTEFIYSNRDFYIAIALCSSLLHSAIAIDIAIRVDELGTNVRSRAALSKKVGRYDIFLAPRAQVAKCQMFVENCQFFCSIVCVLWIEPTENEGSNCNCQLSERCTVWRQTFAKHARCQRQETLDLPYLTLLCDNLKNRMFLQNFIS
jgi:hypothetical protein